MLHPVMVFQGRDTSGQIGLWVSDGTIAGTHEIGFDCAADTITLRHTARSREGFAMGAVKAAEWVLGKTGFHEFGEIIF